MIWDLRFRIADFVAKALRVDSGIRMWECGLRPLRAVGFIYEPEAGGAIEAYAPEGRWNEVIGEFGLWIAEGGKVRAWGRAGRAHKKKGMTP